MTPGIVEGLNEAQRRAWDIAQAQASQQAQYALKVQPTKPETPSLALGPHEYMQLLRELGYWDRPEETQEEFFLRLNAWDATVLAYRLEAQTAASEVPPPSSSLPSTYPSASRALLGPHGLAGDQG